MQMRAFPRSVSLFSILLLALTGCDAAIEEHGVTGRVTMDDQPLANATVTFISLENETLSASTNTDETGMYTASLNLESAGLPVGKYLISISTYQEGNDQVDPPMLSVAELVPSKYNSKTTLEAEVKPEMNVFDFSLDSDGEIDQLE